MEGKTMVAVIDDEVFDKHIGVGEIETHQRTAAIRSALTTFVGKNITWLKPIPLTVNDQILLAVHSREYVAHVRNQCEAAENDDRIRNIKGNVEVIVGTGSLDSILHAAGAGVQAVRLVLSGAFDSVFCNVRPPGHHARRSCGKGFCVFNNVMIAAKEALAASPDTRVAIVDWDVHHGDGTDDFLMNYTSPEESARVAFINIQERYKSIWPCTGKPGLNKGPFHNCHSFNLDPDNSDDDAIKECFRNNVVPLLEGFCPTIIIISCGFDAHSRDPIGDLQFSSDIYGWMTKQLKKVCPKIVSMLEGGYDLDALKEASVAHVLALTK